MAIAAFAVCEVVLSDADGVFAHEAGTGLQAVDEVFLAQVARKLSPVVYAVPGLYAHEGRVLGGGAPDAYCRRAEAYGHHRTALAVEQSHLVQLRLVEDESVVVEVGAGEVPHVGVMQPLVLP